MQTPPPGRRIRNNSRKKPVNENQARAIADTQIWRGQFNADYDQVVKRVSYAAANALRCGSPPGVVS